MENNSIDTLIFKLKKINFNFIIESFFKQTEIQNEIINTIQSRLQSVGLDSNENKIKTDKSNFGEYGAYSNYTEKVKKNKNDFYRHVTLHDTGEFYKSWKFYVSKFYTELKANFKKDDSLIDDNFKKTKDFRDVILSMTDDEIFELIENEMIPYFIKFLNVQLQ